MVRRKCRCTIVLFVTLLYNTFTVCMTYSFRYLKHISTWSFLYIGSSNDTLVWRNSKASGAQPFFILYRWHYCFFFFYSQNTYNVKQVSCRLFLKILKCYSLFHLLIHRRECDLSSLSSSKSSSKRQDQVLSVQWFANNARLQ